MVNQSGQLVNGSLVKMGHYLQTGHTGHGPWFVTYWTASQKRLSTRFLLLFAIQAVSDGAIATQMWYDRMGIVRFNVPLHTLHVISVTILRMRWPNQQCHSIEVQWLVNQVKGQYTKLSKNYLNIAPWRPKMQRRSEDRERNQARSSQLTCRNCSYHCEPL